MRETPLPEAFPSWVQDSMFNQGLGQKDKSGFRWFSSTWSLVNKTCWVSFPPTSFFEKRPVKMRSGEHRGEAARPESIHLLPPECFLCLPPPTPILPQKTRRWWDTSAAAPPPAKGITPWMSCSPWCHPCPLSWGKLQPWMSRAGQDPQPGHPRAPRPQPHFSSGLFPDAKTLLGSPLIPLGVVVYFS